MAPALLLVFSLVMILRIWKFTVLCDRARMRAHSAAVLPAADHFSTSVSRAERWKDEEGLADGCLKISVCIRLHKKSVCPAVLMNSSGVTGVWLRTTLNMHSLWYWSCADRLQP
ncbi:hypothetical protein D3C73_1480800 [compost metagenome]